MALSPRKRRADQQKKEQQKAYDREKNRQRDMLTEQAQRDFSATQEGVGIMEQASISLGSVEDDDEDNPYSLTGLVI